MQELRAKLRAATADDHRRTEESFAAGLEAFPDSYGAFLLAHARAFPAVGRALAFGLDWPAWRARWHDLESDLAALDLDPPPALTLPAATSRGPAVRPVAISSRNTHSRFRIDPAPRAVVTPARNARSA